MDGWGKTGRKGAWHAPARDQPHTPLFPRAGAGARNPPNGGRKQRSERRVSQPGPAPRRAAPHTEGGPGPRHAPGPPRGKAENETETETGGRVSGKGGGGSAAAAAAAAAASSARLGSALRRPPQKLVSRADSQ